MASAIASTSAYVFPPTTDPPPRPPAHPPAAAAAPPLPPPPGPAYPPQPQPQSQSQQAEERNYTLVYNHYGDREHDQAEYEQHERQDGDHDDDEFDELGSEPESTSAAPQSKRRKKDISAITLGSDDAPGLSGGRLKRFMCSYPGCGKCYTRPIRLEEHQRSHTGERPYKCPDCDATFQRDSHLKAHARSHLSDSDKRYPCGLCDKRFWTNQHVKKHVEMVHNAKGYDVRPSFPSFRATPPD